jgi:hypothetical protein
VTDVAVSEHAAPTRLALLPLRRAVLEQQPSPDMSSGTKALLEDLFHELTVDEDTDEGGQWSEADIKRELRKNVVGRAILKIRERERKRRDRRRDR